MYFAKIPLQWVKEEMAMIQLGKSWKYPTIYLICSYIVHVHWDKKSRLPDRIHPKRTHTHTHLLYMCNIISSLVTRPLVCSVGVPGNCEWSTSSWIKKIAEIKIPAHIIAHMDFIAFNAVKSFPPHPNRVSQIKWISRKPLSGSV